MNSKCSTFPSAETMKNEDESFEIIIQQIKGGTHSSILNWESIMTYRLDLRLWMTFVPQTRVL